MGVAERRISNKLAALKALTISTATSIGENLGETIKRLEEGDITNDERDRLYEKLDEQASLLGGSQNYLVRLGQKWQKEITNDINRESSYRRLQPNYLTQIFMENLKFAVMQTPGVNFFPPDTNGKISDPNSEEIRIWERIWTRGK